MLVSKDIQKIIKDHARATESQMGIMEGTKKTAPGTHFPGSERVTKPPHSLFPYVQLKHTSCEYGNK